MTGRPPRASTRGDGKRAKTRGGSHAERDKPEKHDRPDRRRSASVVPTAAGRTFAPKVIGAVTAAPPGEAPELPSLVRDVTQLLEQAQVTGASLAVES